MSKQTPKILLVIVGVMLIISWLFVGTLPISEADNQPAPVEGRAFAPLQTEEPSDDNSGDDNPDDGTNGFDPATMPETIAITGVITNGTPGGSVPGGLTVNLFSIEFDQAGQPIAELASEEVQSTEGGFSSDAIAVDSGQASFAYDALPVSVNAGVVAQVIYNGVPFVSEIVPAHQETDGVAELDVTIYEVTTDTSEVYFSEIWYIVGASPEEDLTEIYNWYFIRNDTDNVIYDEENGGIRIPLPPGAFGIQVEDTSGRFQIDESGAVPILVDYNPLRSGEEDQLIVTYLLPYNEDAMTFSQSMDYPANRLNVYVARIFDLKFEGDEFADNDTVELQTLGEYNLYSKDGLSVDEQLTFNISGSTRLTPIEEDAATSDVGDSFLDKNANLMLIVGALMVALGFAYLFVDLQRQRAKVTEALHNVQGGGQAPRIDNQAKDRLLDEIAQLDDAFDKGEVEENYYNRKRAELKDRLRDMMEV